MLYNGGHGRRGSEVNVLHNWIDTLGYNLQALEDLGLRSLLGKVSINTDEKGYTLDTSGLLFDQIWPNSGRKAHDMVQE